MKAASKKISEINEPVAMLEFELESGHVHGNGHAPRIVRCEMDRAGLADILSTLDDIQRHIDNAST